MTEEKFEIKIPDWKTAKVENLEFILSEAKDYIKYVNEESNKITNRAFSILTMLIPIISALIVLLVSEKLKPSLNDNTIFKLISLATIVLIIILFGLSRLVFPRNFIPLGREPREICIPDYLNDNLGPDLAMVAMLMNEIEKSQVKIDYNERQNIRRATWLKWIMGGLGILLLASTIVVLTHFNAL